MDIKYEIACRNAGLSEENTAEIRRFFDAEKKKLNRRKEAKAKSGFVFLSMEGMQEYYADSDMETFDVPDFETDVEEEAIHSAEIGLLRKYLEEFSEDDRVFLLECFSGDYDAISRISERTGIARTTLSSRKSRLLKRLQEKFQVK